MILALLPCFVLRGQEARRLGSGDSEVDGGEIVSFRMSKSALVVIVAYFAGCLAACTGSSGDDVTEAAAFLATADSDPFYAQPDPMPQVPPGTIIKSRAVTFAPAGVPLPNPAWQLQYMSVDLHARPQAQIATVVKPLVPAASGDKPLLSYHLATDSPGLDCAPSHQLTGSRANPPCAPRRIGR
jgi:hypothetical protein